MTDSSAHYDALETRDPEVREAALMAALPTLVSHALGAPGWAARLTGVAAGEISSRRALMQLPVTRKSDLHALQEQMPPFAGLTTTPLEKLGRVYLSPGPIFDPEGRDSDWWRFARPMHAAGIRSGQLILNCFSYHFTPAGFMADLGARALGCPVIPAGTGNTELQLQAISTLRPAAYIGAPSFLRIILEKAIETGADVTSLKRALVSGEALPPSLRAWLVEHGIESVLQVYGSADLGTIAYETVSAGEVNPGMVIDEQLIVEIVRPGTGDVVPDGEVGEVVVTSFNRDYPLIRFATGDLSAVLPGVSPCGRSNVRIRGWLGRADQTTKVRAMFVHPGHIAEIVARHPAIARARLVVTGSMGQDTMTLHCEPRGSGGTDAASSAAIEQSLRDVTKLRGEIVWGVAGSLPNDGKVISDERSYE